MWEFVGIIIVAILIIIVLLSGHYRFLWFVSLVGLFLYIFDSTPQIRGGNEPTTKPPFVDQPYDRNIDDQLHIQTPIEEQMYLTKSYFKNVQYAFPKITDKSYIPPKFKGKSPKTINCMINDAIIHGENKYWNNKALSYMRKDVVGKRIMNGAIMPTIEKLLPEKFKKHNIRIIDATANIGGDSINAALHPEVKEVVSYEMCEIPYKMLVNNVKLYGLQGKIKTKHKRFDYKIKRDDIVIVDPPYERGNNPHNFNLSIEMEPIYYVVEKLLDKGAALVIIGMPINFQYNSRFARDNNQHISVYQVKNKNVRLYLITHDPNIGEACYEISGDPKSKSWYKCKIRKLTEV